MPSLDPKWIGIPFKWGGRSFRGVDCAGLIRLFLWEKFKKRLPWDLGGHSLQSWFENSQARMVKFLNRYCRPLQDSEFPSFGDITVIHVYKGAAHVGIMVDYDRFLHIAYNQTSCIGRISAYGKHRVIGYWRAK